MSETDDIPSDDIPGRGPSITGPCVIAPYVVALVVAAGKGVRAGGDLPKQYRMLGQAPVIAHAITAFLAHPRVDAVQVVIAYGDEGAYHDALGPLAARMGAPITGGSTRQASVLRGLEGVASAPTPPDIVLIHDAARPFVNPALIDRVIDGAGQAGAAIPALAVTDTLKRAQPGGHHIDDTVPRADLYRAQTPQGFGFQDILAIHRTAALEGLEATDDAALFEQAGKTVILVKGDPEALKVTTPDDFARAERRLDQRLETRVGQGFDVHRFQPGDHVTLCGVRIAHDHGLKGHSDSDVGLHALTDAILGALSLGDIGQHFPPSDPQWRDADSAAFLRHALALAADQGAQLRHLDVTLMCERPKIGPHRDAMRARIAEITGLALARVSVKATTTEGLGFTGRGEGIAAQAIATLKVPDDE